eukprot:scaffold8106_cov107-Isochrysis_galbana.AAC.13
MVTSARGGGTSIDTIMWDRDDVELPAVASVARAAKTRESSCESWASEETVSSRAPLSSRPPSAVVST